MNSDRYVIWRGRQVAKASALGAAIVRCDFESVFRMERQQELLDAIARAKTGSRALPARLCGGSALAGEHLLGDAA